MSDLGQVYGGMRIIIDDETMSETVEDWSGVRSPARAARRRNRGFPQRIRFMKVAKQPAFQMGDRLVMHSEMYRKLREATSHE